jgi:hypothetical protein
MYMFHTYHRLLSPNIKCNPPPLQKEMCPNQPVAKANSKYYVPVHQIVHISIKFMFQHILWQFVISANWLLVFKNITRRDSWPLAPMEELFLAQRKLKLDHHTVRCR